MRHKRKVMAVVGASLFALGLYTQQAHGSDFCDRQGILAYEIMKAKQVGFSAEEIKKAAPSEIGQSITDLAFTTGQVDPTQIVSFSRQFGMQVKEKCEESTNGVDI